MSKGTRVYPVRIPDELMEQVEAQIRQRNQWSMQEAWTLSDFIRVALTEKIDKMARSRGRRGRIKPTKAQHDAEEQRLQADYVERCRLANVRIEREMAERKGHQGAQIG